MLRPPLTVRVVAGSRAPVRKRRRDGRRARLQRSPETDPDGVVTGDFFPSTGQRPGVPEYHCHACGERFSAPVENEYGTYEFGRCPNCDSARTTLAGE